MGSSNKMSGTGFVFLGDGCMWSSRDSSGIGPPPFFSKTVACGHRDLGQVKGSDENHLIIQNRT